MIEAFCTALPPLTLMIQACLSECAWTTNWFARQLARLVFTRSQAQWESSCNRARKGRVTVVLVGPSTHVLDWSPESLGWLASIQRPPPSRTSRPGPFPAWSCLPARVSPRTCARFSSPQVRRSNSRNSNPGCGCTSVFRWTRPAGLKPPPSLFDTGSKWLVASSRSAPSAFVNRLPLHVGPRSCAKSPSHKAL